jgi:hypothetical protein
MAHTRIFFEGSFVKRKQDKTYLRVADIHGKRTGREGSG